jgi:hypothetical protein
MALAFSFRWYYSKTSMNGNWCSGPSLFIGDFAIGHRAEGVTLQFPTFVCNSSSAFLRVIRLMILATQSNAFLHARYQVICRSFLNIHLWFSSLSREGTSLLRSEGVILLVDSLYAEAIEAVKSRAALSVSSPELICILCEINSEVILWNRPHLWIFQLGLEDFKFEHDPVSGKWLVGDLRPEYQRQWLLSRTFLSAAL